MLRGCVLAALTSIGIAITWLVAIIIGLQSGILGLFAAIVAAGIITAFAWPQFVRGYNECVRRRR